MSRIFCSNQLTFYHSDTFTLPQTRLFFAFLPLKGGYDENKRGVAERENGNHDERSSRDVLIGQEDRGPGQEHDKFYNSLLTKFVSFLGDRKIGSLSIDDARRFIAHLQSRHLQSAECLGGNVFGNTTVSGTD